MKSENSEGRKWYRVYGSLSKTWAFSATKMKATGASWTDKEHDLIDILTRCVENKLKWE